MNKLICWFIGHVPQSVLINTDGSIGRGGYYLSSRNLDGSARYEYITDKPKYKEVLICQRCNSNL